MSIPTAAELSPAMITARSRSSFLSGFTCLGRDRRAGMTAIYAFCRVADDAVDEARDRAEGAAHLDYWRQELDRVERGAATTPVGRSLQWTLQKFGGNVAPLRELLLGMAMDFDQATYPDLAALEGYCHCVASAVGVACLPVLGVGDAAAVEYAEHLGQALQLTNILRDVVADARLQRVYVPQEWLRECAVDVAWLRGDGPDHVYAPGGGVAAICDRLAAAASRRFAAASTVLQRFPRSSRRRLLAARIMAAVYKDLLARLKHRGGDLRAERVRIPKARRLWLLATTFVGVGG